MTDELYVYRQDMKEKNSTKSGAYHKRSGRCSHYVGLPSDHLTAAQKKRRNGPVESVKLNTPMTYAELIKLTPTMHFLYLDHLIHKYKARRKDLVAMLGICEQTWSTLTKKLPGKIKFTERPQSPAPEWLAFISPKEEPVSPKEEPVSPASLEVGEPIPIKAEDIKPVFPLTLDKPVLIAKPEVNPYRVTLELNGTPAQLSDLIAVLTDSSTTYNFAVTISAGKEA